jgi:hypothetical protein
MINSELHRRKTFLVGELPACRLANTDLDVLAANCACPFLLWLLLRRFLDKMIFLSLIHSLLGS